MNSFLLPPSKNIKCWDIIFPYHPNTPYYHNIYYNVLQFLIDHLLGCKFCKYWKESLPMSVRCYEKQRDRRRRTRLTGRETQRSKRRRTTGRRGKMRRGRRKNKLWHIWTWRSVWCNELWKKLQIWSQYPRSELKLHHLLPIWCCASCLSQSFNFLIFVH